MKFNRFLVAIVAIMTLMGSVSCRKEAAIPALRTNSEIESLKINQLQVIGSHNSYRKKTFLPLFNFVNSISGFLPPQYDPASWDYDHLPLPEQLGTYGMRSFEIDIYNDPRGGRFYNRAGNFFVNAPVASGVPDLRQPGFKVLHLPDFDYMTHYFTFKQSLQAIKTWSDRNPRHVPIFIMIEAKSSTFGDVAPLPGFAKSVPYDAQAADAIDAEIRSIFGNSLAKVITPDMVRGSYNTLNEAVLAGNWPSLGEARGRVIFILDGALKTPYLEGHPSLRDRAMFVYAEPGSDEAAFLILNNPVSNNSSILNAVNAGYIVRTMAGGPSEARSGDYTKANAAFQNGAHIIHTDYYRPDSRHTTSSEWTDFKVIFPDNSSFRINPVSAAEKLYLGKIPE
jgi:hypothetical protein